MSTVRLVHFDIPAVHGAVHHGNGDGGTVVDQTAPALLVSYFYLEPFLANQHRYRYRDWVMDSGAFSAHNSGVKISLNKYIDACLDLLERDKTLTEVFALDVIGDAEASRKNCEEMWRQGVPAIPCFHSGEPEEYLLDMAAKYPKVALGGVALERGDYKLAWLEQCFARVWPKKVHGFGMASEAIVYGLPFHSVDATNWELAPCAFGNWQKFGQMSVRGSNQDLRSQVKFYLDVEAKARVRWKREMSALEALGPSPAKLGPRPSPAVRLAMNGPRMEAGTGPHLTADGAPSARLAYAETSKKEQANGSKIETALGKRAAAPAKKPEPKGEMDKQWTDYWSKRFAK